MSISRFAAVVAITILTIAIPAPADFRGITWEFTLAPDLPGLGPDRLAVDIYATFDDPEDRVIGVAGNEANPIVLTTNDPQGFASVLVGGSPLPEGPPSPTEISMVPAVAWDSFPTIGLPTTAMGNPVINFVPLPEIVGTDVTMDNHAWFTALLTDFGRAGNYPAPPGDAAPYRVLVLRLTVRWFTCVEVALGRLLWREGASGPSHEDVLPPSGLIAYAPECAQDCNGNGIPDPVEINDGFASDVNENGIVDACELDGDVNGDGVTDVDDIVAVVLGFGPCPEPPTPCIGDADLNGAIDIDDIVRVILGFD